MFLPVLYSALAGIVGTGLGGVLGLAFLRKNNRMLAVLLAFAAGIMAGISCFDLIPEALKLLPVWDAALGAGAGALLVALLDSLMELMRRGRPRSAGISGRPLTRSGYLMLSAIALHNLPEGLAIGASGSHDLRMGVTVALLIALHDVPEGMSVALPLYAGGMSGGRAIAYAALSGAPTLVGGLLGTWWGAEPRMVALALSGAGGAMLFVTFSEMLPQALGEGREKSMAGVVLFGLLVGLITVMLLQ